MEIASLLIFAAALAVNAGSPGPSIAALVARVVTRGWRDVLPFLAAMWIGEGLWLTMAVFGLVVIAETFHHLFLAIKWLGIGYLLYLAWKMWMAPAASLEAPARGQGGGLGMFLTGMALTLGNPKIMVFYLALLPTIIDVSGVTLVGWAELTLAMLAVLIAVDMSWVAAAAQARRLIASPRSVRLANRAGATAMVGAAAAIATR